MKIPVLAQSCAVEAVDDALEAYLRLRQKYADDALFLLESLSGPERVCTQSIVGFEPLITFSVQGHTARFGHFAVPIIAQAVAEFLGKKVAETYEVPVKNMHDVMHLLREIEALFEPLSVCDGVNGLGWFGYFGYDTIFLIEQIVQKIPRDGTIPVISLAVYRGVIHYHATTQKQTLTMLQFPQEEPCVLESIIEVLQNSVELPSVISEDPSYETIPTVGKKDYLSWFELAKRHIDIGDIYQIQIGHELKIRSEYSPIQVYMRMRSNNPSPYMFLCTTPFAVTLIGASPEMFTNLDQHGKVVMRPIAGTVRNPVDSQERVAIIKQLKNDTKEIAEHVMLVDLCRNDIARCCIPTTLCVDELMVTEIYSHVIHLVSNVIGTMKNGLDKFDAIAATFPAGTMTGTPKVKAVEIIEQLERTPREAYAGTVGYFGFNNIMISALCIRMAICRQGIYSIRASGGIVEDSTAEGEWNETISKLSAAYLAITNKELRSESFTR